MTKKTKLRLGLLTVVVFLFLVYLFIQPFMMGDGSPWMANRLAKRFLKVTDPNDAANEFSRIASKRYPDNTWICVAYVGSHGRLLGGTIVSKDSNGTTRAFFGHVCSGAGINRAVDESNSIDEVYAYFTKEDLYREYLLPR